jgi:hypothetical protein
MKVHGISPKVWSPLLVQVAALLANVVSTGRFDRVAAGQAIIAAASAIVGYYAPVGPVVDEATGEPISPLDLP